VRAARFVAAPGFKDSVPADADGRRLYLNHSRFQVACLLQVMGLNQDGLIVADPQMPE
jgi:hypothetical protein